MKKVVVAIFGLAIFGLALLLIMAVPAFADHTPDADHTPIDGCAGGFTLERRDAPSGGPDPDINGDTYVCTLYSPDGSIILIVDNSAGASEADHTRGDCPEGFTLERRDAPSGGPNPDRNGDTYVCTRLFTSRDGSTFSIIIDNVFQ